MKSPAGLLLTATVALSYSIAANYEGYPEEEYEGII